ncbi:MAG: hypothetical protein ACREBC_37775, partial [Pyrinomonadaceae bacterium]
GFRLALRLAGMTDEGSPLRSSGWVSKKVGYRQLRDKDWAAAYKVTVRVGCGALFNPSGRPSLNGASKGTTHPTDSR